MHSGSSADFKNIRRVLVIKLRHIGDVMLSVPVFRALGEVFPGAHIDALVNSGTEEVLTGNPFISDIIVFKRDIKKANTLKKYASELLFLRSIRSKRFDMALDLTGGDRAALLSFVSGARYRLGLNPKKGFMGKKFLYTHLTRPDNRRHMVLQNLDVTRRFGVDREGIAVDFHTPEADKAFVNKMLEANGIGERDTVVHIHPTSRWLFKCWKDEYMAEIVRWLVHSGIKVVLTSSSEPKEIQKARRILSLVAELMRHRVPALQTGVEGGVVDLCGKTTIKQLGAVSQMSDLFFGVDTAPMHIAAAVGTPVVALFGPSGAFKWGPWDNKSSKSADPYFQKNGIQTFGIHTVIQRDWRCIPCGRDGCNGSKISKCLEDIKPEEVKKILSEKLKSIE
jgi:heptosyltransferase-3